MLAYALLMRMNSQVMLINWAIAILQQNVDTNVPIKNKG